MKLKLAPTLAMAPKNEYPFTILTLAATLIITALSPSTLAKNTLNEDTASDSLLVTSTAITTSRATVAEQIDVINAQAPEYQSATSALDLLKGQPGVTVTGNGGTYGQSIHMRGYDSRGVKIMVDDIAQDFNSGLFDATFIDPTLIKKVYVHKGSGSLHHGGGALGGVISIKTLNASDLLSPSQKLGGRAFSGINRNDHSYYAGSTLLGRTESFDALFSYSQRKKQLNNPFISKAFDSDEKIHNWVLKTTWLTTPGYRLGLQLKEYRNDSTTLKNPTVGEKQTRYANTPHQRKSHQKDIILTQHFSPKNAFNWRADWNIYYTNLSLTQLDLAKANNIFANYGPENRHQHTYGTQFTNSLTIPMASWANHYIQSGLEYYQQHQKPNQYAISYPPAQLTNRSGWVNNDMTLHNLPITLSAGSRFTQYKTSRQNFPQTEHSNWSSRFALSITPTYWLNIHSSYSEGYRAPRMAELYNDSNHFKGMMGMIVSNFKPSPDLQPETNKTTEFGLKLSFDDVIFTGDALHLGTNYFNTKAKNYIAVESQHALFMGKPYPKNIFFVNIPSASIYGFDSFINYKTHKFDINISHNKTIGKEDHTNYSLSSIRPETLFVRFNAPLATTGLHLGWIGEFTAKTQFKGQISSYSQSTTDRHESEIIQYAGYDLHDFYINYQADRLIKGLSSTLVLKNAFDREYVSSMGIPQEGRNFYFNVNYQW